MFFPKVRTVELAEVAAEVAALTTMENRKSRIKKPESADHLVGSIYALARLWYLPAEIKV